MLPREQIFYKKRTFFFRFPHGGTKVSSADFFFEYFGKKTLQHRVSIVIGLKGPQISAHRFFSHHLIDELET